MESSAHIPAQIETQVNKAIRAQVEKPNLKLNLPIYLDPEIMSFIEDIAKKKNSDLSTVVNDLIKTDMQLAETMK